METEWQRLTEGPEVKTHLESLREAIKKVTNSYMDSSFKNPRPSMTE